MAKDVKRPSSKVKSRKTSNLTKGVIREQKEIPKSKPRPKKEVKSRYKSQSVMTKKIRDKIKKQRSESLSKKPVKVKKF